MYTWCQWTHLTDLTIYAHLVSMDPTNRPHNICTLGFNGPTYQTSQYMHTWCQWTHLTDRPPHCMHTWCQWTHLTDLTIYAHLVSMDPPNRPHNICKLGVNGPTYQTSQYMHTWCQWTHLTDITICAQLLSMDPPNRPHNICTLGVNGPT